MRLQNKQTKPKNKQNNHASKTTPNQNKNDKKQKNKHFQTCDRVPMPANCGALFQKSKRCFSNQKTNQQQKNKQNYNKTAQLIQTLPLTTKKIARSFLCKDNTNRKSSQLLFLFVSKINSTFTFAHKTKKIDNISTRKEITNCRRY